MDWEIWLYITPAAQALECLLIAQFLYSYFLYRDEYLGYNSVYSGYMQNLSVMLDPSGNA